MGSYCSLSFDDFEVISFKSYVPDGLVSLFQEADRLDQAVDDNGVTRWCHRYVSPRETVLQRLDVLGLTQQAARSAFEAWRDRELQARQEWIDDGNDLPDDTFNALHELNFDEWSRRIPNILRTRYSADPGGSTDDLISREIKGNDWLYFEASDDRLPLRAMLDACADVHDVILDVTDLIQGGWIEIGDELCKSARSPENISRPIFEPTVILGEGSSDVRVLRISLAAFYPHLKDYFSFFDHAELNVDGGTAYLVKFLQAFGAARISTRMVALFDNDTAGREALARAQSLRLPRNITTLCLPDIELARAYPTIGPQGAHTVDINGTAASIELYLGRRNLTVDGDLLPVRWGGYVDKMKAYQGEVQGKTDIVKRFVTDLETHADPIEAQAAFPELLSVWQAVFAALR